MANGSSTSNDVKDKIIIGIVIALIIFGLISCFSDGGGSGSSGSESQRCSYCGKVIFNDGRAIHATHEYLNTYKCDYCGHSNVKR